jgi:hypothetical protein
MLHTKLTVNCVLTDLGGCVQNSFPAFSKLALNPFNFKIEAEVKIAHVSIAT